MRAMDRQASELGPYWLCQRPSRARAAAHRQPVRGIPLAWGIMLVCAASVVWNCGQVAFNSMDRVNQQLQQALASR